MKPRSILVLVVASVVVVVVVLWSLQRRMIYFPAGPPPPVEQVLASGAAVTLTTADGLELEAWWLEAGPTAVAFFPGNAGNRAGRAPLAAALHDLDLSVLLVDYRGYGGNPGSPSERGLLADGRAAVAWLTARPRVDDVVYFGESLGAAVAVALAAERSPAAIVLRSPFTSLVDVARTHYGPVPEWLLADRFPSVEQIGSIDAPVLVLAGDADEIIPIEQSRALFEAASPPKRFATIEGGRHNDPSLLSGIELLGEVRRFLEDHGLAAAG